MLQEATNRIDADLKMALESSRVISSVEYTTAPRTACTRLDPWGPHAGIKKSALYQYFKQI